MPATATFAASRSGAIDRCRSGRGHGPLLRKSQRPVAVWTGGQRGETRQFPANHALARSVPVARNVGAGHARDRDVYRLARRCD